MYILVVGGSGFIGSKIVTDLISQNYLTTVCDKNVSYTKTLFPSLEIIPCDFLNDIDLENWIPRLKQIDVVINCIGIFHHPNREKMWKIHYDAPKALFDACVKVGIKKVIHISALGIENYHTEYALSKKAMENYLLTLPLIAVILKPSLVYGHGSYGGTALFRGLASFPKVILLPGDGNQEFQPIYINDLSRAIVSLINYQLSKSLVLAAVCPHPIKLSNILITLRNWLGFSKAKLIRIPFKLIELLCIPGTFYAGSTLNLNASKMLKLSNIASEKDTKLFQSYINFIPLNFTQGLYANPSTVENRWYAKLYFLKPLLKYSIAFLWLFSGITSIFFYSKINSLNLLGNMGIIPPFRPVLLYGASLLDFFIGFAMIINFKPRMIYYLQLLIIIIYTTIITWKLPNLWFEPFGPISKNIPIFVSILILLAINSER